MKIKACRKKNSIDSMLYILTFILNFVKTFLTKQGPVGESVVFLLHVSNKYGRDLHNRAHFNGYAVQTELGNGRFFDLPFAAFSII